MKYVDVAGVKLSAIGVGTWQFGSREWGYGDSYAEGAAIDIVHRALDLGVNLIDTAEIYGFGESERIVGRAIAGRRDEAFVATKVFPVLPLTPVVVQRGEASARRLAIDVIDLYQQHWPNPAVPLTQSMGGMRKLVASGRVRQVGVSNFGADRWAAADRALGSPVFSNQVEFSLAQRKPLRTIVPFAQANDRVVIAYSPLAQGFLGARYDKDNRPGGVRAGNPLFLPENLERGHALLETLRQVAKAHDATPAQVALAWVIHHPNVVAIPGASSVAQLEANCAAADLELTEDEFAELSAEAARFDPITGMGARVATMRARRS